MKYDFKKLPPVMSHESVLVWTKDNKFKNDKKKNKKVWQHFISITHPNLQPDLLDCCIVGNVCTSFLKESTEG